MLDTAPPRSSRSAVEPPDPTYRAILRDVVARAGQAELPEERYEFWLKRMPVRHPRTKHPALYKQLFVAATRLARYRVKAALQLFALATLGLDRVRVWRLSRADGFLGTQSADAVRARATQVAMSGLAPPMRDKLFGPAVGPSPRKRK